MLEQDYSFDLEDLENMVNACIGCTNSEDCTWCVYYQIRPLFEGLEGLDVEDLKRFDP